MRNADRCLLSFLKKKKKQKLESFIRIPASEQTVPDDVYEEWHFHFPDWFYPKFQFQLALNIKQYKGHFINCENLGACFVFFF